MGASKQAMMDEIHRISTQEYDEDDRAKNDDAAFCAKENYDSNINGNPKTLDDMSGIPSRDTSAEEEEMKKLGGGKKDG